MFRLAFALFLSTILVDATFGQGQQFPYKARVTADEVYVRSGAGEKFYPTHALTRDATVTVRRHDPGGWYMVDPPKGSFSWIPSKYVRRISANQGEVLDSNVVVFVGSAFGNEASVWQRMLKAGEKVTILAEQQIELTAGLSNAFKIAPPQREYRWIRGSAVLPLGAAAQAQRDRNPYEVPSHIVQQQQQQRQQQRQRQRSAAPPSAAPVNTPQPPTSRYSPTRQLAQRTKIREEKLKLYELDQQFRGMILSDPSQWKLEKIEQAYLELQSKVTHKPIAGQIDLRYPAIRRYRQRKAEFDDLNRLTSETERRDSQLLNSQYGLAGTLPSPPGAAMTLAPGQSIPSSGFGTNTFPGSVIPPTSQSSMPLAANGAMLIPNINSAFTTTAPAMTTAPTTTTIPASPGNSVVFNPPAASIPEGASTKIFVGAGYVQRGTASEGSGYLLLSNEGKVLAHLKPNGSVDLDKHIGRAVGVKGNRYFDKSLKSDRIDVTGLESVTIR